MNYILDYHTYYNDSEGLSQYEVIRIFNEFYNAHFREGSNDTFRIVHGYGSSGKGGAVSAMLRKYFCKRKNELDFQCGEQFLNNPGVTIVYPKKKIEINKHK